MAKKTIYYRDPLKDDFASLSIHPKPVTADFPFLLRGPLWKLSEFFVYRMVATPVIFLIGKVGFGLRIRNRRVLKELRGTGFYLYGNHTQNMMDAYTPSLAVFPHHAHIVTGPEAVSAPVLRRFVQLLGAIPLPDETGGVKPFRNALKTRLEQGRTITIYPEAHIWPWYTGIRPFTADSFSYPVRDDLPVLAFATTYRQRKLLKNRPPRLTVTLSEPFYPDPSLSPYEARQKLRNQVYGFLLEQSSATDNYAYYDYVLSPASGEE